MRVLALVQLLVLLACVPPVLASSEGEKEAPTNARGFEYLELKPSFVVNFGTTGRVGFLKADVSLKVASGAKAAVAEHMPAIRHELIMLLSRQDEAALASAESREALRTGALEAVRARLVEIAGIEAGGIQDLLFTSFITQR